MSDIGAKKKECTGKCFHMFDRAESMRKEGVRWKEDIEELRGLRRNWFD